MGLQFHETVRGKNFFEYQLPSLIKAVSRIADNMEDTAPKASAQTNVYVCYHENSPELSIENPVIDEMTVAGSLEEVKKIVNDWVNAGKANEYVPLNDSEKVEFFNDVMSGKDTELLLYHKQDENSRLYYALAVKPFTSANGLYPKATCETYDRLRAVMASMEKSEKLGEVFCEQIATDDEKAQRIGYYLAKAILDDSIEDLLVAVCGWTSQSLLNIADFGSAYQKEE